MSKLKSDIKEKFSSSDFYHYVQGNEDLKKKLSKLGCKYKTKAQFLKFWEGQGGLKSEKSIACLLEGRKMVMDSILYCSGVCERLDLPYSTLEEDAELLESYSKDDIRLLKDYSDKKLKRDISLLKNLEPSSRKQERLREDLKVKVCLKLPPPVRIWDESHLSAEKNILYDHFFRVWKMVNSHESSWPFRDPVKPEEAPMYYELIANPIDLSMIKKKIAKAAYGTKADYAADYHLMASNCRSYNIEDENLYRKLGNEVEQFANQLLLSIPEVIVLPPTDLEPIPDNDPIREEIAEPVNAQELMQDYDSFDTSDEKIEYIARLERLNMLKFREKEYQLPFEERRAITRDSISMGAYFLNHYNIGWKMEDDQISVDKVQSVHLPEYGNPTAPIPYLSSDVSLNGMKDGAIDVSKVISQLPDSQQYQNFEPEFLSCRIPQNVQKLFRVRNMRYQMENLPTIPVREVNQSEELPETIPDYESNHAILKGVLSLFIAHEGFTHTSEAQLMTLTHLTEQFIVKIGEHMNIFKQQSSMTDFDVIKNSFAKAKLPTDLDDLLTEVVTHEKTVEKILETTEKSVESAMQNPQRFKFVQDPVHPPVQKRMVGEKRPPIGTFPATKRRRTSSFE